MPFCPNVISRPIPRHLDFLSLKESQQKCTMITLEQAHSKCGLSRRRSKVRQSVFFLKLLLEKGSLSFEKKNRVKFLPWMRDITELEQNALGELMQHFSRPTLSAKIYSSNTNSGISHPKKGDLLKSNDVITFTRTRGL